MSDDLVDVTHVRVINSDDPKMALMDPKACLQILQNYAGNLSAFVKHFHASTDAQKQAVLFAAKNIVKQDKAMHREWEEAIQMNKTIRIELLQCEALDRLEGNDQAFEEKHTAKGVIIKVKESDAIAFAKLTIGDVFAARTAQAKRPVVAAANDDDLTDTDDDDVKKAMEDV